MTQLPPAFDDSFGFFAQPGGASVPAVPAPPQQIIWSAPPVGYPPPDARPPRRNRAVWVGVVLALVVAGGGSVFVLEKPKANSTVAHDPGCDPKAPQGASPAGREFLTATAAADVYWYKIGQSLTAESNVVHRDDLAAQVNADQGFLSSLSAINYPASAQADADSLQQVIRQYDGELTTAYNDATNSYLGTHSDEVFALDNKRAIASGVLRQDLGIGGTTCNVQRP